jgi:hypothetical protein
MFTWICPKCGREVPPAYNECPDCNPVGGQPPAAVEGPPVQQSSVDEPRGPAVQPPPPQAPAPQVHVRPYTPLPAAPSRGLPTWLLTILIALSTLGVVAGFVWTIGYFRNRPETKPSTAVESPAARPGAAANPWQKFVEVSGVRFSEDPKSKGKVLARFVITNHSDTADISGLAGNVTVWGATRKSEEDAQGTFTFKVDLRPLESKEMTAPFNTKLKIYELPDWQNVTTDIQITAPAASSGSR